MKCRLIEHNQTEPLRNLALGKAPDKKNSYFSMNTYNVFNH